jgi:hypothetical protein
MNTDIRADRAIIERAARTAQLSGQGGPGGVAASDVAWSEQQLRVGRQVLVQRVSGDGVGQEDLLRPDLVGLDQRQLRFYPML